MLDGIILSVVMLSAVAPFFLNLNLSINSFDAQTSHYLNADRYHKAFYDCKCGDVT